MKTVVFDCETNGLDPTVVWCIVCKDLEEKTHRVFTHEGAFGYDDLDAFNEYAKGVDVWVAHNGISFDVPVVNRLLGTGINEQKVVDTFIVSRLINYSGYRTHSLEEIGLSLGEPKSHFNDWANLTQEMIDYCIQDVVVNEKIFLAYKRYVDSPDWQPSIRLEHDMAITNNEMSANGFMFNKKRAEMLLTAIKMRMSSLELEFQRIWPPELVEIDRIKYQMKKDGSPHANVLKSQAMFPKTEKVGDELIRYNYSEFNPGSPKDRLEKLWAANWSPVERTKTHNKFLRDGRPGEMWGKTKLTRELYDQKREHFAFYGWVVNETNLKTLPEDAPEGAHKLAEWLCLEGRRSSLEEWLGCVSEDGRIRGKFWHIGAWTHRMSHSNPNQANIFSPFHGEINTAVDAVKNEYDRELRALWCTDKVLVGSDADGIQLRILCHYMQSEDYREAILNGKKEDQTDIHNLNRRALGLDHITRDDAKTFIYAFLLGAGIGKIASILRTDRNTAKQAMENFFESLPELKDLKSRKVVSDARRGYFTGLDGRKVVCDSEHLMLAGYLQNGEAVAMKMWIRKWKEKADEVQLKYKLVDFVHDEVVCEVDNKEDGEKLLKIQEEAMIEVSEDLGLFCPLTVSGDVGKTWADVH